MEKNFVDLPVVGLLTMLLLWTVILVDTYEQTPLPDGDASNESVRLGNALSSSGLSITLTSLCSATAFFVGSAIDVPAVTSLCVYAGWSFLANYVLQFLFFVPFIVLDDHRIRSRRNFCCPFYRHKRVKVEVPEMDTADTPNSAPKATNRGNGSNSSKDSYLLKLLSPIMTRRATRCLVIISFLCTFTVSIFAVPKLHIGGDAKSYFPDDSPALDFLYVVEEVMDGTKSIVLDVIIEHQDLSDIAVRDNVYELMADLESQDDALDAVTNWLDEFEFFLNETGQDMDTMDSSQFHSESQLFEVFGTYIIGTSSWNNH